MKLENNFQIKQALFDKSFNLGKGSENVTEGENFQNVLKECVDEVNEKNIESNAATNAFVRGDNINIDEVMIKATEANLSLQFLTTTRDKLVEGYKELTKMQI